MAENQWEQFGGGRGVNKATWKKPWQIPGDKMVGIFVGRSTEPSKFGGDSVILDWRDPDSGEEYRTRAAAALARDSEKFEEGRKYEITFDRFEESKAGRRFKFFVVRQGPKSTSPF